eukprot:CAMPEP_0171020486 /NCGR_PEP_ID=MMETSP0736-20130129/29934_1 /TAXON_ID=186038 /ORGANISM="Fragilariopsis kerguelensis, Strain L26-C5" /LENGTH=152 /DNA_ID=CAMNT_0011458277 /DNA_START=196 /DNA_END=654 /DNA_ORIENTATION=+
MELPYLRTTTTTTTITGEDTSCHRQNVPHIYWSVSKSHAQSQTQVGSTFSNPSDERTQYGDHEASDFVTQHYCGVEVGQADECVVPAAYRAQISFGVVSSIPMKIQQQQHIVLYSGLYLDSDLIPLVPWEDWYDPSVCTSVMIGPKGNHNNK